MESSDPLANFSERCGNLKKVSEDRLNHDLKQEALYLLTCLKPILIALREEHMTERTQNMMPRPMASLIDGALKVVFDNRLFGTVALRMHGHEIAIRVPERLRTIHEAIEWYYENEDMKYLNVEIS